MDRVRTLVEAVTDGDTAMVQRAVRAAPGHLGRPLAGYTGTALHLAAEAHHTPGIRGLLAAGVPVDVRDEHGNTPLHWATYDRGVDAPDETVRLLLAAGADTRLAANQHPDAFDGTSVIAPFDAHGVVLEVVADGLRALRRPWSDTYHPAGNDWEHVFGHLPWDLLMPVTLAWLVGRTPAGSDGRPAQLSAFKVDALPKPFPAPDDPRYRELDLDELGHVTRLPVAHVPAAVARGEIADPETVALLYAIRHEIAEGL